MSTHILLYKNTAHINIKEDFNNTNFINKFDEIWAMYSLPLYSPNIEHAVKFYLAAIIALKPGGILRIAGHPRTINSYLCAPIHFPCDEQSIFILNIILNTQHRIKIKQQHDFEKYIAPKNHKQKNKLNERLIRHK